jgi:hypothetical protein
VTAGIGSIPAGSPSPGYVRALTVWLELLGVSPAAAVLLNLGCYIVVALIVVEASSTVTFAAIALGALTFSPALIIFGTQVLKDSVCVLLIVLAFSGARMWVQVMSGTSDSPARGAIGGGAALSAAVLGLGSIRAYFAFFIIVSVTIMGLASVITASGRMGRIKALVAYPVLLLVLWGAFAVGAGAYYAYYGAFVDRVLGHPAQSTEELDRARSGFVASGGATSVTDSTSEEQDTSVTVTSAGGSSIDVLARIERTVRGCMILFVPITVLRAASVVSFTGGQGLLVVTDVDTLIMDLGIVCSLLLLLRSGLSRTSVPVAIFALALAAMTTLSMAYVVTNFGTIFRLRLLAATPLWILPAFVGRKSSVVANPAAFKGQDRWT